MSSGAGRDPVVVGIDRAGTADGAVDWAAAEAAVRGCPLRIVHACRPPPPADPYGVLPPIDGLHEVRAASAVVLRDSVARARWVASDIEISTRLLWGAAAVQALLDEAQGARMLVLGSRGLCGLRALLARSVSAHVTGHASCPVVIVPSRRAEEAPVRLPPRVVVGVKDTASCAPPVEFAFRAARQRGIPLTALHAWTPDPPADLEAVHGPSSAARALGHRILESALERWRPQFPEVSVIATLVRGDPARALVNASRGAALSVVGPGRGRTRGAALGSVSRAVLQHGHSPIAVIRPDGLAPGSPAERDHGYGGVSRRWPPPDPLTA